ncbi:zinc-binding dehydrogenase [Nocardia brasiliensis]|uniref:zinc-binding dehydrogenase n=1 Tax=Nocardia brasiliensis TaxID=37326 RepID=UPI001D00454E
MCRGRDGGVGAHVPNSAPQHAGRVHRADGRDGVAAHCVTVASTRSLDTLRPGGLIIAVPSGVSPDLRERAAARGMRAKPFLVEPDGHALAQIAALIDDGEVHVEVEEVLPLDQAAEAHRRIEQGRTRGKLVLHVA